MCGIGALFFTTQVRLEDARGTDRQEILIDDRVGRGQAGGHQHFSRQIRHALGRGTAGVGQLVAVIAQSFLAQRVMVIREAGEHRLQALAVVATGAAFATGIAGLGQQLVVQRAALRGQRKAALFDLAEARGMGAGIAAFAAREMHGLFQCLEAGLAQQDRAGAARRAFDHRLGGHAVFDHRRLRSVDVQRARGQVIDVRATETDHVGHQAVRVVQRVVGRQVDRGIAVPAEGFQCFLDEALGIGLRQAAVTLGLVDQCQRAVGEDAAARKDLRRFGTQRFVFDQLQAQQRGEHAERILRQRRAGERAERGGMHRHARDRQVVVADRVHAHHREQAAQRGQFLHGAHADRAMAFFIQARALVVALQLRGQSGVLLQHLRVDPLHQFHQRAVQRHFGAVHAGHGLCEQAADHIRRNQRGAHQSLDYGNGGTARTRIVAGARGGGDMQSNMKQTGSAGRWRFRVASRVIGRSQCW